MLSAESSRLALKIFLLIFIICSPLVMLEKLDSEKLRVFTPRGIQYDIDTVIKANSEAKKKLKELYRPIKV